MARRILYVHGMEGIGGAELDLARLIQHLDGATWYSAVACPPEGAFRVYLDSLGIRTDPLALPPWRKLSSWYRSRAAIRELCALLDRFEPALVHVNDIWWVPQTVRAVRRTGKGRIPILAHVRQNIRPEKVRQYALDRVAMTVAVSERIRGALHAGGVAPERTRTLYSGVEFDAAGLDRDVRSELHIPAGAMVLGTVANILGVKGYDIIVDALPAVLERIPDLRYLIVGTGAKDAMARLEQRCRDRGVRGQVHFAGFQKRVAPYLAAMDLYIQPSLDEAFGLAAAEAMAAGLAVVASNVGGLPEIVEDGRSGLLVPPGDPEQLSAAILNLLQDTGRRESMGRYGASRARERFDCRSAARSTETLYEAVLVEPGV